MTGPKRRLHKLRGGDGTALPNTEPPERWPDMEALEPYWESFTAFARSELGDRGDVEDIRTEFVQQSDGTWTFRATTRVDRQPVEPTGDAYTQTLVYDPSDDEMEFTDTRDGSTWVMEAAFGDPYTATSRL